VVSSQATKAMVASCIHFLPLPSNVPMNWSETISSNSSPKRFKNIVGQSIPYLSYAVLVVVDVLEKNVVRSSYSCA